MISLDVVKTSRVDLNDPAIDYDESSVTYDESGYYYNNSVSEEHSPNASLQAGDKLEWLDIEKIENTPQNDPSVTIDSASTTIDSTSHYITDFAIQSVMNKPILQNGDIS